MTGDYKYELTLILRDARGTTKIRLDQTREKLLANPALASLLRLHETFMPKPEKPASGK